MDSYRKITFTYNSISHLILSLLFLFSNFSINNIDYNNLQIVLFCFGHLLISFALYFLQSDDSLRHKLSSIFGIFGHLSLFLYTTLIIFLSNFSLLAFIFLIGQIGMIYFYTQIILPHKKNNYNKNINIATFTILTIWYGIATITNNKLYRIGFLLVCLVYANFIIYTIMNKKSHSIE